MQETGGQELKPGDLEDTAVSGAWFVSLPALAQPAVGSVPGWACQLAL